MLDKGKKFCRYYDSSILIYRQKEGNISMKRFFCILAIFLFFYFLNIITPISFGDDYVYSFIWEGHSLYEPLSDNAVRVSSWQDLLASISLNYFTWSGRVANHTLAQFFLWNGKSIFNVCNALVSTFLVAEIYWCSHKGVITAQVKTKMFCGIFLALWAFTPKFGDVFLWLEGACNYLWTAAFLIGFLLPYLRKFYSSTEKMSDGVFYRLCMFFLGLVAGCTNENTICWVIPVLLFQIFKLWKSGEVESWLYYGMVGLMAGYALLLFAPGNMARLLAENNSYNWLSWKSVKGNAALLFLVLVYYQIFPWYFNLRSLCSLRGRIEENTELKREIVLVKVICAVSFCMTFVMLLSPNFPPRSAFPGTVFLIIAACILFRLQEEYAIILIKEKARRFLCGVGIFYFFVTATATFYGSYYNYSQINELISFVKSSDYAKNKIIEINSLHPVDNILYKASGFHIMTVEMSDNANDWRNVAFSRYYGIKGIRIIKRESENMK